jgi:hypothetical protein
MLMPNSGETNDQQANWSYQPEDAVQQPAQDPAAAGASPSQTISWTASEFIEIQKGAGWHIFFFAGIIIISGLIFFFTHDYIAPITIVLAAIIFVIITSKKPRELSYQLSDQGIQIGERLYKYEDFKSFDIGLEGGAKSINLLPLHRLMPEISMYFPPEQEAAIIDLLSIHLPHQERVEKAMDKVARKLRF